jgi:hypothetical protein
MRRVRFHIGTLLAVVLILAVAFAALRESNVIWDSGVFTLTTGVLLISFLLAIHRMQSKRAFWLGFALFGATYLGLSLVSPIESRLVTTKALAYVDSKLPRSVPVGLAYVDFDSDGNLDLFVANNSQPNAVLVDKGNGTFEDVTTSVGLNYAGDPATSKGMIFLKNSPVLGLAGTSASFIRIGHSICALIAALVGGLVSRHLHAKNRQACHGPDTPPGSPSSGASGN